MDKPSLQQVALGQGRHEASHRRFGATFLICMCVAGAFFALADHVAATETLAVEETPVGIVDVNLIVKTIVISPDGRHIAYAGKRGDRFVFFLDGQSITGPCSAIAEGGIAFSPESRHLALIGGVADKWALFTEGPGGAPGGREGKPYENFVAGSLGFSADGTRVGAIAMSGGKRFAVIDHVEQAPADDARFLVFAPSGRHWAYAARRGERWSIVTDVGDMGDWDDLAEEPPLFSADGTQLAVRAVRQGKPVVALSVLGSDDAAAVPAHAQTGGGGATRPTSAPAEIGPFDTILPHSLTFAAGKTLSFAATDAGRSFFVVNGSRSDAGTSTIVSGPTFSSRADHTAFVARTSEGVVAVIDGRAGAPYEAIPSLVVFSQDGQHSAYVAVKSGKSLVVSDGKEGEPCDEVMSAPLFSADGKHMAYVARDGKKQSAVLDGKRQESADAVGRLAFSPDGRLACGVQRGHDTLLRFGDAETAPYSGFLPHARLVFDGSEALYVMMYRGNTLLRVRHVLR